MDEIKNCENCGQPKPRINLPCCVGCLRTGTGWEPKPDEIIEVVARCPLFQPLDIAGHCALMRCPMLINKKRPCDFNEEHKGDIKIKVLSTYLYSLGYYKLDEMEIDKDALTKRVSEWFGTYDREYIKDAIIDLIKANPIKPKTDKESEVGK